MDWIGKRHTFVAIFLSAKSHQIVECSITYFKLKLWKIKTQSDIIQILRECYEVWNHANLVTMYGIEIDQRVLQIACHILAWLQTVFCLKFRRAKMSQIRSWQLTQHPRMWNVTFCPLWDIIRVLHPIFSMFSMTKNSVNSGACSECAWL